MKVLARLIVFVMLFSSLMCADVRCASADGLKYRVSDGKVTVTGSTSSPKGELVIPSEIDGMPVTAIGEGAFEDCTDLTSVVVSKGITQISGSAFRGCRKLAVSIPNTVTKIGASAFDYDTQFTVKDGICYLGNDENPYYALVYYPYNATVEDVSVDENTVLIADNMFNNSKTVKVTVPASVKYIGERAFVSSVLEEVIVDSGNEYFCSDSDALYNKDKTELIQVYPPKVKDKDFTVPPTVRRIDDGAFDSVSSTSIFIPSSAVDFNCNAFEYSSISSFVIDDDNPCFTSVDGNIYNKEKTELVKYTKKSENTDFIDLSGIEKIDAYAFRGCDNIANVSLGNTVKIVGKRAFSGSSLSSLTGTGALEQIGDYAFRNGNLRGTVEIPDCITSVGTDALSWRSISHTIVDGVIYIGNSQNPYALAVSIDEKNKSGAVNLQDGTRCVMDGAFDGEKVTSVKIADSVKYIGKYAFANNSIDEFKIPDGVKSIGEGAFYKSIKTDTLEIPQSVEFIGDEAFYNCNTISNFILPPTVKIGAEAFTPRSGSQVTFCGTKEQWDGLDVDEDNERLMSKCDVRYVTKIEYTGDYTDVRYVDVGTKDVLPTVENGYYYKFSSGGFAWDGTSAGGYAKVNAEKLRLTERVDCRINGVSKNSDGVCTVNAVLTSPGGAVECTAVIAVYCADGKMHSAKFVKASSDSRTANITQTVDIDETCTYVKVIPILNSLILKPVGDFAKAEI